MLEKLTLSSNDCHRVKTLRRRYLGETAHMQRQSLGNHSSLADAPKQDQGEGLSRLLDLNRWHTQAHLIFSKHKQGWPQ